MTMGKANVVNRVRMLLEDDATLSNRAIGRAIRAEGLSAGNTFLRLTANATRQQLAGAPTLTSIVDASGRFTSRDISRAFTQSLEAVQTDFNRGAIKTHLSVNASAMVDLTVTRYGQTIFQGQWMQNVGRFVVPNNPNAIAELVRGAVASRVEAEVIRRYFQGSDSYIEGLEFEIHDITVIYDSIEVR